MSCSVARAAARRLYQTRSDTPTDLLEHGAGRPALLVVAALGQGLLVAPPGGPMPDMVRADGMAETTGRREGAVPRAPRAARPAPSGPRTERRRERWAESTPFPSSAGSAQRIAGSPARPAAKKACSQRRTVRRQQRTHGLAPERTSRAPTTARGGRARRRGSEWVCQRRSSRRCADVSEAILSMGHLLAEQQRPQDFRHPAPASAVEY